MKRSNNAGGGQEPRQKVQRVSGGGSDGNDIKQEDSLRVVKALFATAKKTFTCQVCLKRFPNRHEIQRHFHHDHKEQAKKVFPDFVDRILRCYKCDDRSDSTFPDEKTLVEHLRVTHRTPLKVDDIIRRWSAKMPSPFSPDDKVRPFPSWYVSCHPCRLQFDDRDRLLAHIREKHMSLVSYHCDQCQTGHPNKTSYDDHVYLNHFVDADSDLPLKTNAIVGAELSSLQSYTFSSGDQRLTLPLVTFEPVETKKEYAFDVGVPVNLSQPNLLQTEEQPAFTTTQHTMYKCSICNHLESEESRLAEHIQQVHVLRQPSYEQHPVVYQQRVQSLPQNVQSRPAGHCSNCNLDFGDESQLLAHLSSYHGYNQLPNSLQSIAVTSANKFRCALCHLIFDSRLELSEHQRLSHTNILGDKRSLPAAALQPEHALQAQADQRQELQPGSRYAQENHQSEQSYVEQQQVYECSVCHKLMTQVNALMSHMKKAHGVLARLKCPMCNNTYLDQRGLKRHYQKNHPDGTHVL